MQRLPVRWAVIYENRAGLHVLMTGADFAKLDTLADSMLESMAAGETISVVVATYTDGSFGAAYLAATSNPATIH